jgi:hypothetical protein
LLSLRSELRPIRNPRAAVSGLPIMLMRRTAFPAHAQARRRRFVRFSYLGSGGPKRPVLDRYWGHR